MMVPTAARFPTWLEVSVRQLLRLLSAVTGFKASLRVISRRSGGPRWFFRSFPIVGTIEVKAPDGTTLKYSSTARDFIGRALYWYGWDGYEPETTGLFLALARRAEVVVDVGANTGLYSVLAGRVNESCRIMAIEPVARLRKLLERNLEINWLRERCAVVPTHALDDLCERYERVDLLKIDVEGFEDHVLEGATRVLERSAPIVIVECNRDGPHRAVQALLEPHGYRFFRITSEGPRKMERIEPDMTERFRNVLCLPAKAELP